MTDKDDLRPVSVQPKSYGDGYVAGIRQPITGYFHRWAEKLNYVVGTKSGGAAEAIGIVEAQDGQVYEVPPGMIRFLDREDESGES